MSAGLLKGFRKWLLEQGFAIGTLNHRLSIIRKYYRWRSAGKIPDEVLELVLAVKGYGGKTGRNLDVDRTRQSFPTYKRQEDSESATNFALYELERLMHAQTLDDIWDHIGIKEWSLAKTNI